MGGDGEMEGCVVFRRFRVVDEPPGQIQEVAFVQEQFRALIAFFGGGGEVFRREARELFLFVSRHVDDPALLAGQLQDEDVDVVVVGREALGLRRREVGVRRDVEAEFLLERFAKAMDFLDALLRTPQAKGPLLCKGLLGVLSLKCHAVVLLFLLLRSVVARHVDVDADRRAVRRGEDVLNRHQVKRLPRHAEGPPLEVGVPELPRRHRSDQRLETPPRPHFRIGCFPHFHRQPTPIVHVHKLRLRLLRHHRRRTLRRLPLLLLLVLLLAPRRIDQRPSHRQSYRRVEAAHTSSWA
mmetsp:Transcript_26484/g.85651  ORF Transcript_26484/g.85651 Transcript_26484/m.85651 type:complete len:296 (+) Transcript_26484:210-1097(+)